MGRTAPAAQAARLGPKDAIAAAYVTSSALLTLVGAGVSLRSGLLLSLVGQFLLALGLVQWFVLLHECGHAILFRTPRWNNVAGHVAGFFSGIPFHAWRSIHTQHHRWTGWQDLDPTTATLVPRELSQLEKTLVNVCWKYWIPLFFVVYRLNNFWNFTRLKRLFADDELIRRIGWNLVVLVVLYAGVLVTLGVSAILALLPGVLASMVFLDSLVLSQHTHIPMTVSGGRPVEAYRASAQQVFTRSLRFPRWISQWLLLNVDAHELHHVRPDVPGYHLSKIGHAETHAADGFEWIMAARRIPGEVFFFQNRNQSGTGV